jgi:hypothetical protein
MTFFAKSTKKIGKKEEMEIYEKEYKENMKERKNRKMYETRYGCIHPERNRCLVMNAGTWPAQYKGNQLAFACSL